MHEKDLPCSMTPVSMGGLSGTRSSQNPPNCEIVVVIDELEPAGRWCTAPRMGVTAADTQHIRWPEC
jgi:hypothetical protein